MNGPLDHPLFEILSQEAAALGTRAFVIGGYVRDYFLQRPCTDIDIVVEGSGVALAEAVGQRLGHKVTVFKNFGTAMLRHQGMELEFVGARRESYRAHSRKPTVEDGTLEDDQNRRDFTVNALAFSLQKEDYGRLIDPFNGAAHLQKGILRTPLDPDVTYSDDPLRMMRAVRFATQLGFTIHPESFAAIVRNAERIKIVSQERITEELQKILRTPKPSVGFFLLDKCGLLPLIFPQLAHLKGVVTVEGRGHKENFSHSLQVVDNVCAMSDNIWLRWAALVHDIAKPATRHYDPQTGWTFHGHEYLGSKMVAPIFRQLKLPLDQEMRYVKKMVALHMRPIALVDETSDSGARRLLFEAGDDIDDLMILCRCDITSKNEQTVRRHLANFEQVQQKLLEVEEKDRIRHFQPPISGELIMQTYGLAPCREVGLIKDHIKDAILDGVIPNNYEAAYALMQQRAAALGLVAVAPQAPAAASPTDESDA